jgi:hypothetical protein
MKELNRHTLEKSLRQLPEYQAPEEVWQLLEAALDADEQVAASARQLPEYQAPDHIWDDIEKALESPARQKPAAIRVLLRPLIAIAAVGLLLFFVRDFFKTPPTDSETIVVTQAYLNERLHAPAQEKEDPAFEYVHTLCQSRAPVCEQPEFRHLKSELDELTAAKETLRRELGQYGDDPGLAAQLARIERERTGLLRQMMSMI